MVTIAGILAGVWQFNEGQRNMQEKELEHRRFELEKMMIANRLDAIASFKELQTEKYSEAAEITCNFL